MTVDDLVKELQLYQKMGSGGEDVFIALGEADYSIKYLEPGDGLDNIYIYTKE